MFLACIALLSSLTAAPNKHQAYGANGELLTGRPKGACPIVGEESIHHELPVNTDSVPAFRPSVQIDDSTLLWCRGPFLHVLDDNTVYAILQSGPSSGLPRYIRFTSSSDTGQTWLDPNIVIRHDPNVIIGYPSMSAGQDSSINVIWTEPYNSGILFSRSTDEGLSWSDTVSVDDGVPSGYRRLFPDIISIGDSLAACWTEGPSSSLNWYPWVSFSTDGGATWAGENQIGCVPVNTSSNWPRPYIRFDPLFAMFYVLWPCNDGEVYVARSPDGTSWQSSTVTVDNVADANYPTMAVGPDGTVYVVWNEARYGSYDTDIFMSMSTDSGATWSNSILVNDQAGLGANQYEAHISLDKRAVIHVSWIECIPFGSMTHAYYTQSVDGGATWEEPNLVVTDIPYTITPNVPYSLALASDTASYAYVGWTYDFYGTGDGVLNFFSTNSPENAGIEENKRIPLPVTSLSIFPNPFIERVAIRSKGASELPHSGEPVIQISDVTGRRVRKISLLPSCPVREECSNGVSFYLGATWDGRDENGKILPPGIYFLKLNGRPSGKVVKAR